MLPSPPVSSQSPPLAQLPVQFPVAEPPEPEQLDSIKAQLDLALLALESLTGIGSEAILDAATALNLANIVADRVALWRLRQASPLRKGKGRKRLDVDEARSLVLITCYLAKQHQELLRRAVALLERLTEEGHPPHRTALLGDYVDTFSNTYEERMTLAPEDSPDQLTTLAFKLLIDLFFYSTPNGAARFWATLLERSHIPH
ncbi:MAG: DUF3038 domain-containing protein [Merismopedia sp. SIO2A8]|nr:DUF3038 domain-containing protein [Symploca sp. SIO2B6]NET52621.1 DUF3038 domain-containing protein [Merismopedia sp. SIO2A8]